MGGGHTYKMKSAWGHTRNDGIRATRCGKGGEGKNTIMTRGYGKTDGIEFRQFLFPGQNYEVYLPLLPQRKHAHLKVLLGMVPVWTQTPPRRSFLSTTATRFPAQRGGGERAEDSEGARHRVRYRYRYGTARDGAHGHSSVDRHEHS